MRATEELLAICRDAGLTVACAESCTGGLVAAELTRLPGSSVMFDRGVVTYSNEAKQQLLGVQRDTLARVGAVSEEVAQEMAIGLRRLSGAQLAVSVSGIAGPGGSEHKPEGRVCFALAGPDWTRSETVEFGPLGREAVRMAARDHALSLLLAGARRCAQDAS